MFRLSIVVDNTPNKICDAGNAGMRVLSPSKNSRIVLSSRSHAGHLFLCVFVDYSNKIFYKMFLELKLHYFQYIYCLSLIHI